MRFFVLWRRATLYYFSSANLAWEFFYGNREGLALGRIDLAAVFALNVPQKGTMKLQMPSRSYLLEPKGSDDIFLKWLTELSGIIQSKNTYLASVLRDNELQKDPGLIDADKLQPNTVNALQRIAAETEGATLKNRALRGKTRAEFDTAKSGSAYAKESSSRSMMTPGSDSNPAASSLAFDRLLGSLSLENSKKESKFVGKSGWVRKKGKIGRWRRRYLALWRSSILYYFKSESKCDSFFQHSGQASGGAARGNINLADVFSVRVRQDASAPAAIELHTLSRVHVIVPEGGAEDFNEWLSILSSLVKEKNRTLGSRSNDPELQKPVNPWI